MEILVIGGSRFVGPILVEKLLSRGHSVTVFNRGKLRTDYGKARFVRGDRERGFSGVEGRFDAVIDMCAYEGRQTSAALRSLDFGLFVHMGTVAVYRKSEAFPLTEDSPVGAWPLWGAYNRGKAECERVLAGSGSPYASLRPVYILGKGNYVERESFVYRALKAGRALRLPGDGQAIVQFVFSDEVAESLAMIAEKNAIGAFNCAGDDAVTLKGLVGAMAAVSGAEPKTEKDPDRDGERFDESAFPFANEHVLCSNGKLKALGMRFRPLLDGLRSDYEGFYRGLISP
jgi:2'-hydroxyisoflavone reductase